jgi:hypothetical protein
VKQCQLSYESFMQQMIQLTLSNAITDNNSGTTDITSVMALFIMVKDAMNLQMPLRNRTITSHRGQCRNLGP